MAFEREIVVISSVVDSLHHVAGVTFRTPDTKSMSIAYLLGGFHHLVFNVSSFRLVLDDNVSYKNFT